MQHWPLLLRERFKFGDADIPKTMVGRGLGGKNCFKFVSSCFKFVGEQEVTEEAQEEFSQKGREPRQLQLNRRQRSKQRPRKRACSKVTKLNGCKVTWRQA